MTLSEFDPADIARLRADLDRDRRIVNPDQQRRALSAIQTEAMIDIAASLQVLAVEALSATPALDMLLPTISGELEPDVDPDAVRDFLVVGDLVHLVNDTEPGEVVKVGTDQGETFADVDLGNGVKRRLWQRELVRIIPDRAERTPVAAPYPDAEAAHEADALAEREAAREVDDDEIEDDFVEPRTDDALAELERREAAKKRDAHDAKALKRKGKKP
jgi:hypothetical protein